MAVIINEVNKVLPEYSWSSIANMDELVKSKNLKFNVRILEPGQYSL